MLLSLKTSPYLHRLPSPFKTLRSPSPPPLFSPPSAPRRPAALSLSSGAAGMSSSPVAPAQTIEHFVLFKVRDTTDPSRIDAMISNLRSLVSLDVVAHLGAGPVLRHRSSSASALGFTHLLHSRYRSKPDLAAYGVHPAHQAVVKDFVLPICDDIMAVDWVAEIHGPLAPPPGSAVRLTLAKTKEEEGAAAKEELLAALAEAKGQAPAAVRQVSYGENFSPARAKGYSVGFLTLFPGVEELDAMDGGDGGAIEAIKEKVRPLLDSIIVLDFVVSPPPTANL